MSITPRRSARRLPAALAALLGTVLVATTLVALPVTAAQAAEPVLPATVTADSLPAPQIDSAGIVWTQAVVAGKVWAGGKFTKARPSGAAAGVNEVSRSNLLSYDLQTGALTSFSATFNGQVLGLTGSPDGSRVYVVGEFTTVNGQTRNRVAAFDTATGALISTFRPSANFRVRSVVATADTVYLAGHFTGMNSQTRTRLAAVKASDGTLLPWAPSADDGQVMAITMTPDKQKIVVGGFFTTINGQPWYGMGAVDAVTGENRPWQATSVVRNAGANAAIYSLTSDGTQVYGTGYHFGAGGNLEGSFAAEGNTGQLAWVNGCRGDTYSGVAIGPVYYSTGHPHDCSMIGGLPQTNPWTFQRAMATTSYPGAGGKTNTGGQLPGTPAPDLLHWLPTLDAGTVSGSTQAGWHITGTADYVLVGGEFPRVNNRGQYGLARFAVSSKAPNKEAPQGQADALPVLTPLGPGALRVSWTAMWDRDDATLDWQLLRGATTATSTVIASGKNPAAWWTNPAMGFVDPSAPAGSTQTYRVRHTDADGNTYTTPGVTGTVPAGSATPDAYTAAVRADAPTSWWRLGEASGTTGYNWVSGDDVTLASTVTRGVGGAVPGDAASQFPGGSNTLLGASTALSPAPGDFSVEAWISTTTKTGGKIVGFGNSATGSSGSYDRHVYMTNTGRLVFGVYPGSVRTVTSPASYNDGQWHHVVATVGSSGMKLVVDGIVVGERADTTSGQAYAGYWRIGGDNLGSWPDKPTSSTFTGAIDDVAVYSSVLSATRARAHYEASGRSGTWPNEAPVATFATAVSGLRLDVDASASTDPDGTVASYAWNFGDGTTGTGATATRTYTTGGTKTVTLTVTDNRGATTTTTRQVTVTAPPANQAPTASFEATAQGLTAQLDASGSTDPDGTVASYAWNFGDGSATGSGATTSRTYAAAGTYTVTLTVTDDDGATATTTRTVTVTAPPPNAAPTASFTAQATGLTVQLDGTGSTDGDGTVASYAWSFGDGTTGTGATTSRSYAAAGTYAVTLTVTDDDGATSSVTQDVVVTAPTDPTFVRDTFERSVASGWGTADLGGAWSVPAVAGTTVSVTGGTGRMSVGPGRTVTALLSGTTSTTSDVTASVGTAATAAGGATYVVVFGRRVEGAGDYRVKLRQNPDGTATAQIVRTVTGTETALRGINLPGTWTGGTRLQVRLQVLPSGASTTVRTKVWPAGTAEPAAWSMTTTDSTASLQGAGSTGFLVYTSGSATVTPVVTFDDLVARPVTAP